jgi:hypothetical protein
MNRTDAGTTVSLVAFTSKRATQLLLSDASFDVGALITVLSVLPDVVAPLDPGIGRPTASFPLCAVSVDAGWRG